MAFTFDDFKNIIEHGNERDLRQAGDLLKSRGALKELIDALGPMSRGLLHVVAALDKPDMAKALIEYGARLEQGDIDGSTPLHVAAMKGSAGAAAALIEAGADANAVRGDGKTPLMFAAFGSALAQRKGAPTAPHEALVSLLKMAGANPDMLDQSGKSAMAHIQESDASKRAWALADPDLIKSMAALNAQPPQEPQEPKPALAQGESAAPSATMPREEAIKKLLDLGFEILGAQDGSPLTEGREADAQELATILSKRKSALIVGQAGVGKRALAKACAEELAKQGKILMSLPSSSFRGDKYAGSVNANIQKWLGPALALGDELALFVNDAHQLSTGKTSSDNTDTPLQILRERMDPRKERKLTLLCASSPKEVEALEADQAFMSLLSVKKVEPMDRAGAIKALESAYGKSQLLADHPNADEVAYDALCRRSAELCDKYLFNLPFPGKAFSFAARALAQDAPQAWTQERLDNMFCEAYSVPKEVARGRFEADSPYLAANLEQALNGVLKGQQGPMAEVAQAISAAAALANPKSHSPMSMLFGGPTGVGKTETAEELRRRLGLPMLTLACGEIKTAEKIDEMQESMRDFCSKNYAGILLVDEIEKIHTAGRDVFLSLLEKGVIGSGENEVKCGFLIVVLTTNVAAKEAVAIKKKLRAACGDPKIHDSWLRGQMIDAGFRAELVNRIDLVVDYNDITPVDALSIAQLMFAKRAREQKESRGLELSVDESLAKSHAADIFDPEFGTRGIKRCVDGAIKSIVARPEIVLALEPGARLSARSENGAIIAVVHREGREPVEARINQATANSNEALERLNQVLSSFGAAVDGSARSAMGTRPLQYGPKP
jgi:ATP-dependent Clp protease ATP-binding subunit ClpA